MTSKALRFQVNGIVGGSDGEERGALTIDRGAEISLQINADCFIEVKQMRSNATHVEDYASMVVEQLQLEL